MSEGQYHLLECSRCGWKRYAPVGYVLMVVWIGERCLNHMIEPERMAAAMYA